MDPASPPGRSLRPRQFATQKPASRQTPATLRGQKGLVKCVPGGSNEASFDPGGFRPIATLATPIAAQAAPWQNINARQQRLDARIDQGVRSGSLNRAEAQRLRGQFQDLNRLEASYRRSGGGLSSRERADLDRRFDALSARIKVQKHDRQGRR